MALEDSYYVTFLLGPFEEFEKKTFLPHHFLPIPIFCQGYSSRRRVGGFFNIGTSLALPLIHNITTISVIYSTTRSSSKSTNRLCKWDLLITKSVHHTSHWKTIRGTQRQFLENICSEDDLRYRIFKTFVVKFLACLPLLGFSNI